MRYILTLSAIILCLQSNVVAQSYAETALLFSRVKPGGSARIQSLAGAQVALGGDYSSAFSNPAGLGMFNRSEFTITPALSSFGTKTSFRGNELNENLSRFQIPGLSFVFNLPGNNEGSFVTGSFAISLNRVNDFNRSSVYEGTNPDNSIIDYFIDQAFGATTSQFDEDAFQYNTPTGLAYYNYLIGPASLIDPAFPNDEYFTDVQSIPNQREEMDTKGAMNQWSISYGANFIDKFFVGGGIGISSLRYKSRKTFTEDFPEDPYFTNLYLEENLEIKGSGINATLGAIVRPIDYLQIGVAYTTPTFFQLAETYEAGMNTRWKNFDYYGDGSKILNNVSASTDIITSDYNLTIPSKFSVGLALLSKYGFISGDVEMTNSPNAEYSSDTPGVSFGSDNNEIKSIAKSVVNYRLGAEYRYEIFRARVGYGMLASPYKDDPDAKISSITGGLGVRMKKFYIDFALIYNTGENRYQPYSLFDGSGPVVDFTNTSTTGMITLGFTY